MKKYRKIILVVGLICTLYGIYFGINAYTKTPDGTHLYRLSLPCFIFVIFLIQLIVLLKFEYKK
jgi:hypothetical protein